MTTDPVQGSAAHRKPKRRFWWTLWRATSTAVTNDFLCPLAGYEGQRVRLEWLQVQRAYGDPHRLPIDYEIPRRCVEALGVNCSPLDHRDSRGHQGAVWFTREQAEAMRAHRHAYRMETANA